MPSKADLTATTKEKASGERSALPDAFYRFRPRGRWQGLEHPAPKDLGARSVSEKSPNSRHLSILHFALFLIPEPRERT